MKTLAASIVVLAGAILWGLGCLSGVIGTRLGWSDGTIFGGVAICFIGIVVFLRAWIADSNEGHK